MGQVECSQGRSHEQDVAGRERAERAAEDARRGRRTWEVRGIGGGGTVRGRGTSAGGCEKKGRAAEGRKGQQKARDVKGA